MRFSFALSPAVAPTAALAFALLVAACAQKNPGTPPPNDRYYFPTGIAWVDDPAPDGGSASPGFLYVVSSNFDLRFNSGTLAVLDLSTIEPLLNILPDGGPIPANGLPTPLVIPAAHIANQVVIDSFGGPLTTFQMPNTSGRQRRLFEAGRQNNLLQAIDVDGTTLTCAGGHTPDCSNGSVVLTTTDGGGLRDAYRSVVADGQVYVDHISVVDNPFGSGNNEVSNLAAVDAVKLGPPTFFPIGVEPVDGLATVGGVLFMNGRAFNGINNEPLRRFTLSDPNRTVSEVSVTAGADVIDGRAMTVSSDSTRMFMVTRIPDALLVLDVTPDLNGLPTERVLDFVEVPSGANELQLIPRGPGRRDLVAVSCSNDGSIAIYDDEIGRVVSVVHGLGDQPFGMTLGKRPGTDPFHGVRLYATSFGRGNLAIIDLPDLDHPETASVLAVIGPDENCLNDDVAARPPECPP